MNTHRVKHVIYCRAIKINDVSDHPDIVVDPSGFEGAKIFYKADYNSGFKEVHKGDFVIERDGYVTGVLCEQDFHRMWQPVPATVKLGQALTAMVAAAERGGQHSHDDVELWIDGTEYGCDRLTLSDVKAFVAEQKGIQC